MKHEFKNPIAWMIIGAIVIALIFFWIGDKVGASHAQPTPGGRGAYSMNDGGMGGRRGGGFANGTILSMTPTSITISLQNGGSQTIYFTNNTPIMKSVAGIPTDLQIGQNITVTGTANADGSLAAQSVSIRPARPVTNGTATPIGAPVTQ